MSSPHVDPSEIEEVETLRAHLANMQTSLAILVKRAGGRLYLSAEELEAVLGHAITMTEEDDGAILLYTTPPQGAMPPPVRSAPRVKEPTHHDPNNSMH